MKPSVVVLGAGINGMSCALGLQQCGINVILVADKFYQETLSGNAPGLWTPHANEPKDKILQWSRQTYLKLKEQMSLGWPVEFGLVTVHFDEHKYADHFWWLQSLVESYTKKTENDECVITYFAPTIRTAEYLKKQMEVFVASGGTVIKKTIQTSISDLLVDLKLDAKLIVNCLGHSSSTVFNDSTCFPIRGVLIKANPIKNLPTMTKVKLNHPEGFTYITLRPDVCLLGGTIDVGNSNNNVSGEEAEAIIKRCTQFFPELNKNGDIGQYVFSHWAGSRPGRPTIRIELDTTSGPLPIVHNYGHGGSGWTLSYGCSLEVVQLVLGYLNKAKL